MTLISSVCMSDRNMLLVHFFTSQFVSKFSSHISQPSSPLFISEHYGIVFFAVRWEFRLREPQKYLTAPQARRQETRNVRSFIRKWMKLFCFYYSLIFEVPFLELPLFEQFPFNFFYVFFIYLLFLWILYALKKRLAQLNVNLSLLWW